MTRLTFRPLRWDRPETPFDDRRSRWTFKAAWRDTLTLLDRELEYLDAETAVVEADFREGDLRVDGLPRANARQPQFPGVKIAFTGRPGPLVYATDAHAFWQHNVRAIALALEALRAVDRYGVTHSAEQYTGWRQIGSGPIAPEPPMTRHAAAEWLAGHAAGYAPALILASEDEARRAYRAAARALHPDVGGDAALFRQLQTVIDVLERAS